eukprot:564690-Prymnesium_polylepis.3
MNHYRSRRLTTETPQRSDNKPSPAHLCQSTCQVCVGDHTVGDHTPQACVVIERAVATACGAGRGRRSTARRYARSRSLAVTSLPLVCRSCAAVCGSRTRTTNLTGRGSRRRSSSGGGRRRSSCSRSCRLRRGPNTTCAAVAGARDLAARAYFRCRRRARHSREGAYLCRVSYPRLRHKPLSLSRRVRRYQFGVYTGGTMRSIAKKVRGFGHLWGFDSFTGLPEETEGARRGRDPRAAT